MAVLDGSTSFDQDDGIAYYQWTQTQGTPVVLSDSTSDQPTFLAPDISLEGETLTFQLTVTDNSGLHSQDSCAVNIALQNEPPIANAGEDKVVDEGSEVMLNGEYSTDTDDGIAYYHWEQLSGALVTIADNLSSQILFTAPEVGPDGEILTFRLTVTDNGGLQSTDECIVEVNPIAIEEIDITPPSLKILSPTRKKRYSTRSTSIDLAGTALDDTGIATITWSTSDGERGTASGTANWTVSGISLKSFSTLITKTATDTSGNQRIKKIRVFRNKK
jgi:hypothetical protein